MPRLDACTSASTRHRSASAATASCATSWSATSASGAVNAIYEGIRCDTGEFKVYARHDRRQLDAWRRTPSGSRLHDASSRHTWRLPAPALCIGSARQPLGSARSCATCRPLEVERGFTAPRTALRPVRAQRVTTRLVAVDHLGLGHVAQQPLDLGRGLAAQQPRFGAGVVGQAARDLDAGGVAHRDHVAARKLALDRRSCRSAAGSCLRRAPSPRRRHPRRPRRAAAGGRPSSACAPGASASARPARCRSLRRAPGAAAHRARGPRR